jgi:hypothetical protein
LKKKYPKDNKISGAVTRHFGRRMSTKTKLRLHNITSKAALRQGSEVWILSKRYKKKLEAAQMRFSSQAGRTKKHKHQYPKYIVHYQNKWRKHVARIEEDKTPIVGCPVSSERMSWSGDTKTERERSGVSSGSPKPLFTLMMVIRM